MELCKMLIKDYYLEKSDRQLGKMMPQLLPSKHVRKFIDNMGLKRDMEAKRRILMDHPGVFKAGNSPSNSRPEGTVLKRADGYWYIKTATGTVQYHRWLWQQAYGPVPEGMCVCIVRKISKWQNLDVSCLRLATPAELILMNHRPAKFAKRRKQAWRKWRENRKITLDHLLADILPLHGERLSAEALIADWQTHSATNPGLVKTNDVKLAETRLKELVPQLNTLLARYYQAKPVKSVDPAFARYPDF